MKSRVTIAAALILAAGMVMLAGCGKSQEQTAASEGPSVAIDKDANIVSDGFIIVEPDGDGFLAAVCAGDSIAYGKDESQVEELISQAEKGTDFVVKNNGVSEEVFKKITDLITKNGSTFHNAQ